MKVVNTIDAIEYNSEKDIETHTKVQDKKLLVKVGSDRKLAILQFEGSAQCWTIPINELKWASDNVSRV